MKFGKRIIIINSVIIAFLTAVIVLAAALAGTRVLRANIRNTLVDTVTSRAAIISGANGAVPDNFDYNVNGIYLGVYLSDGSLKNASFPGEVTLPINRGVISSVKINGADYYVYDYAVFLEGRDSIYLRGVAAASYDFWFAAVIIFSAVAVLLAAAGVALNIISVKRAVRPIEKMREEVNLITDSRDITKRLSKVSGDDGLAQLADDYNYMLDSLEAMFRNHERFTADVAHEIRTPLTVILSESEYALADTDSLDEKNRSLGVINRQSQRLKAITEKLIEFTRVANRLSISLIPVNLSEITEEFLADYPFGEMQCTADIEPDIAVNADITLYERALQNLVDNAVKYGKAGGSVAVTLKREGTRAVLTVADKGAGMDEEELKHVFERFYRAEASRNDKQGLGLGLSFVKEIVRLLKAEISIDSKKGDGTRVTVTFNLLPPQ